MAQANYQFDDERSYKFDDEQPYRFDDEQPGILGSALESLGEVFRPLAPPGVKGSLFTPPAPGEPGPGVLSTLGGAAAAAFPVPTALYGIGRGVGRAVFPETVPVEALSGLLEGTTGGAEPGTQVPFRGEASEVLGAILGGLRPRLPRAPISPAAASAIKPSEAGLTVAPPPVRKALLPIGGTTRHPWIVDPEGRIARDAASMSTYMRQSGLGPERVGGILSSTDDVAAKAALVRAERSGPRVLDPATGEPVFAPGESVSQPGAIAEAGAAGQLDRPWPGPRPGPEATGARVPPPSYTTPRTFELPDPAAPLGTGPRRGQGPPEVNLAANADAPFPPSVYPITLADRINNAERVAMGKMTPKAAAHLGYDLDIAEAHPAVRDIIHAKYRSRGMVDARSEERAGQFWSMWEGVPEAEVDAVVDVWKRFRYSTREEWLTEVGKRFPQHSDRIAQTQAWFDEIGQYFVSTGRLTAEQLAKNPNYFPFIRERVRVGEKVLSLIEAEGDAYFSVWRGSGLTKEFQEFFQKPQSLKGAIPTNLTARDTVRMYSRSIARAEVIDREFMPVVRANLDKVPTNMASFTRYNINNFLGVPGAETAELAQWQALVKQIQATRTLVGISAPAHNLTQGIITVSKHGYKNYTAGLAEIGNRALWDRAKALGVISKYTAKDLETAAEFGNTALRLFGRASDVSLLAFRWSENFNRVSAFATALKAGAQQGLTGTALERFASTSVLQTQGPIVRTGIIAQFKPFPIFMMNTYKNLLLDAGAGIELLGRGFAGWNPALMREGLRRTAPLTRFWATTTALFGGDALLPGADERVTKAWLGKAMKYEGIVPYLGVSAAHAIGVGVLPIKDFRSFLFFLPGPALSQVGEIVSALSGRRLNPANQKDLLHYGDDFLPTDVDEYRSRGVRALPIPGAVQLNRIIDAKRRGLSGGDLYASTSWAQSLGMEPATGELVATREQAGPPWLAATGLRPEESARIQTAMEEMAERNKAVTDARSVASTMYAGGQMEKGDDALDKLERDHGPDALAEAITGLEQSIGSKAYARVADRLSRRVMGGPRAGLPARADIAAEKPGVIDAIIKGLTGR